jgi:chromosome segregation and condensation protein ScpB
VQEALSQAAFGALSIVAYEQPVTRADIRGMRGVDSDAVVETLMARRLVAENPRFGGRDRPGFLAASSTAQPVRISQMRCRLVVLAIVS